MAKKTAPQTAAPRIRKTRTVDADNVKIAEHMIGHQIKHSHERRNVALHRLQRFLESAQHRAPSVCDWSNLLATVAMGLDAATTVEAVGQAMAHFNFATEEVDTEVK